VATPASRPLRVYADTSVFGGCFDREFRTASLRFFDLVRGAAIVLLVSELVDRELERAPPRVRKLRGSLPGGSVTGVQISGKVRDLSDAYLMAEIVSSRSAEDAIHVAAATVAGADAIVSWNFRHIVRFDRIRGYNRINRERGYGELRIVTPGRLLDDEGP
jgi:predicted nucleic acid-binding protein